MADGILEFVEMEHPAEDVTQKATASREAYESVWKARGWELVEEAAVVAPSETSSALPASPPDSPFTSSKEVN